MSSTSIQDNTDTSFGKCEDSELMAWYPNQGQLNNGQNPYGTPQPPNTYYPPSQNPYGAPLLQNGMPQYSNSPYYQAGYGFTPPQAPPHSVGKSIKALPKQYMNIVNHPSTMTFFQEISKANWLMVWIQLGIMILAYTILASIRELFAPLIIGAASFSPGSYPSALIETGAASSFGFLSIITVPLSFFFGQAIQYLLAKAFNGQGTFLAQCYTAVLFHVPLNIANNYMSTFLDFIPIFGFNVYPLAYLAWLIYSNILNVLQIKAVHGLTTGKAITVVIIPTLLNLCVLFSAAVALLAAAR